MTVHQRKRAGNCPRPATARPIGGRGCAEIRSSPVSTSPPPQSGSTPNCDRFGSSTGHKVAVALATGVQLVSSVAATVLGSSSSLAAGHHGHHHHGVSSLSLRSHDGSALTSAHSLSSSELPTSSSSSSSTLHPFTVVTGARTSDRSLSLLDASNMDTFSKTVRRISLNIMNSSSSALDTTGLTTKEDHPGAGGGYDAATSGTSRLNLGESYLKGDNHSISAMGQAESNSPISSYSTYLTDIFPKFMRKSINFNLMQPSTFSNDDYDEDYVSSYSSRLATSDESSNLPNSLLSSSSALASTVNQKIPSSDYSSYDETSDMLLMRLMRHVMPSSGTSTPITKLDTETDRSHNTLLASPQQYLFNLHSSASMLNPFGSSSSSSSSNLPLDSSPFSSAIAVEASPSNSVSSLVAAVVPADISTSSSSSPASSLVASTASALTALLSNETVVAASGALTAPEQSSADYTGHHYASVVAGASSAANISSSSQYLLNSAFTTVSSFAVSSDLSSSTFDGDQSSLGSQPLDWLDIVIMVLKIIILGTIILSAIFGNMLVIISVFRYVVIRVELC